MSEDSKLKKLLELYEEMEFLRGKLEICSSCTQFVKGVGDLNSKILFVGEAPGAEEDKIGEPFVGRSGKLFTKILEENGFLRNEVFITNIVKCRPPKNRDPSSEEIKLFSKILEQEIKILNPKIIVTLGRISLGFFLKNKKFKISNLHGNFFQILENRFLFPMYHPSFALRGTKNLESFKKDFEKLKSFVF